MADDGTRWLEPDERDAWIPFLPVLFLLPSALDAQLQRDSGLTLFEYVVMSVLSEIGEDGIRMTDLALLTSAAPSRVSQVVTRMEQRGWVERRPDPVDRRATRVHLRDGGRTELVAAAPGHVDAVRRHVFDHLSPTQVQQLRKVMTRIAVGLVPETSLMGPDNPFVHHDPSSPC